jgi:hypothetical protein
MSIVTLESIIANHPFFAGLSVESLRLISEKARLVELPAGEIIFHQGELAERFYLSILRVAGGRRSRPSRMERFSVGRG